jgi:hypothetical protein
MRFPVFAPAVVGRNSSAKTQLDCGGRVGPHPLCNRKLPVVLAAIPVNATLPEFVSEVWRVTLAVFNGTLPKSSGEGASTSVAGACPVPLRGTTRGPAGAELVALNDPGRLPDAVGVNTIYSAQLAFPARVEGQVLVATT